MPQFEVAPASGDPRFVRARSAEDAVRTAARLAAGTPVALADPEAGSGWAEAEVDGAAWGRVRPRDRMRFRRD